MPIIYWTSRRARVAEGVVQGQGVPEATTEVQVFVGPKFAAEAEANGVGVVVPNIESVPASAVALGRGEAVASTVVSVLVGPQVLAEAIANARATLTPDIVVPTVTGAVTGVGEATTSAGVVVEVPVEFAAAADAAAQGVVQPSIVVPLTVGTVDGYGIATADAGISTISIIDFAAAAEAQAHGVVTPTIVQENPTAVATGHGDAEALVLVSTDTHPGGSSRMSRYPAGVLWNTLDDYLDLSPSQEATCRVVCDITPADNGILMEAGASGSGLVLYAYNGNIYFQCGDGSNYGSDSDTAEISAPIPSESSRGTSRLVVEWSASSVEGRAALYLDGVVQGTDTFNNPDLAGNNPGGIGLVHSGVAANRAGYNSTSNPGGFTGTVHFCDIAVDHITTDVDQVGGVTGDMEATGVWTPPNLGDEPPTPLDYSVDHFDLSPCTAASGLCEVTVVTSNGKIAKEAGGAFTGMALTVHNGEFIFQCGDGSNAGSDADTAEIRSTVPGVDTYILEWSADADTGIAAFYVDGVLVGRDVFDHPQIIGGDAGGIGQQHGNGIAVNPGGYDDTSGTFNGSVKRTFVFKDQVTDDVKATTVDLPTQNIADTNNGQSDYFGLLTVQVEDTVRGVTLTDTTGFSSTGGFAGEIDNDSALTYDNLMSAGHGGLRFDTLAIYDGGTLLSSTTIDEIVGAGGALRISAGDLNVTFPA